jgi:hypothetical protein
MNGTRRSTYGNTTPLRGRVTRASLSATAHSWSLPCILLLSPRLDAARGRPCSPSCSRRRSRQWLGSLSGWRGQVVHSHRMSGSGQRVRERHLAALQMHRLQRSQRLHHRCLLGDACEVRVHAGRRRHGIVLGLECLHDRRHVRRRWSVQGSAEGARERREHLHH